LYTVLHITIFGFMHPWFLLCTHGKNPHFVIAWL
jgi:hypothetical protein